MSRQLGVAQRNETHGPGACAEDSAPQRGGVEFTPSNTDTNEVFMVPGTGTGMMTGADHEAAAGSMVNSMPQKSSTTRTRPS